MSDPYSLSPPFPFWENVLLILSFDNQVQQSTQEEPVYQCKLQ